MNDTARALCDEIDRHKETQRQLAEAQTIIHRAEALVAIVRRGLTAPSGIAICACKSRSPVCWYCDVRAALGALDAGKEA